MKLTKRFYLTEHMIYLVFWIMLFLVPVVGFYLGHDHFMGMSDMTPLYGALLLLLVYFILFIINSYVLIPRLFFKHHVWWYVLITIFLCSLTAMSAQWIENEYRSINARGWMAGQKFDKGKNSIDHGFPAPPDFNGPPPNGMAKGKKDIHRMRPHPDIDMLFHYPNANITLFILSFMVISFNLAISLIFKAMENDIKDKTLAKERISTELEYLKYQINPHFLMNTLNNIHALVDINSEEAKVNIIKLSKMLRFVLYKGPQELVKLQDEIDFLENYIDLMRIRYIDKIDISFTYPNIVPSLNIPTLLIVPFVENAFKHGVSYEHKSFIHVKIECSGNRVLASIVNSKGVESMQKEKEGGIGIENTKRRLQLIYGDDYQLTIKDEKDTYNVELNIKAL